MNRDAEERQEREKKERELKQTDGHGVAGIEKLSTGGSKNKVQLQGSGRDVEALKKSTDRELRNKEEQRQKAMALERERQQKAQKERMKKNG
jgi:hypothetical protein